IELYLRPRLGRVKLDKIGPDQVKALHHHMLTELGLSTTTVRGTHFTLSALLRDAVIAGHTNRNPCTIVNAPGRAVYKVKHLSSAQGRDLLASLDPGDGTVPEMLVIASVALLAGARPEEILGITRDNIDLDKGTITFAWQIKRIAFEHGCGKKDPSGVWPCGRKLGGYCTKRFLDIPGDQEVHQLDGGLYLTRPKSRAGFRVVPMVGPLQWVMEKYLETCTPDPKHGLIFTRDNGLPQEPTRIRARWRAALAAADLPPVNRHSARHTCNTILAELHVPVEVRQKILGHASRAVNEEDYTHTSDQRVREAMTAIGGELDWR
ncbi:MAG TPA: tyrosine-type recombinase/integrase, partial [Nocardioidaceae bacterium]|nr:tyrosine-type recombinase/integrase [Nocardioidaceae bacterium]